MREIKFRGKVKYNGNHYFADDWVYGSFVERSGEYFIVDSEEDMFGNANFELVAVAPETVGQYTGLKDKNGVEIYEGDKIKIVDVARKTYKIRTVIFIDGAFGYHDSKTCDADLGGIASNENHKGSHYCEIIHEDKQTLSTSSPSDKLK